MFKIKVFLLVLLKVYMVATFYIFHNFLIIKFYVIILLCTFFFCQNFTYKTWSITQLYLHDILGKKRRVSHGILLHSILEFLWISSCLYTYPPSFPFSCCLVELSWRRFLFCRLSIKNLIQEGLIYEAISDHYKSIVNGWQLFDNVVILAYHCTVD